MFCSIADRIDIDLSGVVPVTRIVDGTKRVKGEAVKLRRIPGGTFKRILVENIADFYQLKLI